MKFRKKRRFVNKLLIPSVMLVTSTLLCATICFGGNKMEPLYDINETTTIRPEEYEVNGRNLSLFPVPQDNAVGTNDMGNAITLVSFHNGKPSADKFFRNAAHDFEGGGTYLPVIDENTIGFAQSRRFLLFDFKSKDCKDYRIVMSIDKTIRKAAIADPLKKHFLFDIKEYDRNSMDHRDYSKHLLLIDLSGEKMKIIKEFPKEIGVIWSVVSDKLFFQARRKKQLTVLNMNLEPDHHPLADVLKENKERLDFCQIHAHHFLPFAILTGGKYDEVLISWGHNDAKLPINILGRGMTISQCSFSPDGKWLIFKNENIKADTFKTYLMPVSEKYPNYLGSPILLANDYYNTGHFAWTTNPISFVGSSLSKLYRWELTNKAHPESDKPTFHDYIVEKDLEKLIREKKQGLGGTAE